MNLNIEKYSDIISLYPSFISHQFRKIFTEDTKTHALKTILECFEILSNHLVFIALCQLIAYSKSNSTTVDTKLKEKVISRMIRKFSLGSKVEIFRDLLLFFKNSNSEGLFLEFLKKSEDVKDFFEKSSVLVNFRNDLEHKKIQVTQDNENKYFSEIFPLLESIILDCHLFRFVKILVPIENISSTVKFLEFSGNSEKPIVRRFENVQVQLELNKCYIGDVNSKHLVYAHPFWQYSLIKDEYFLLFGQFDDEKKVILSENFKGISIIDKNVQLHLFLDAVQPLYPDYKYQNIPYLSGHEFQILHHKFSLKLISADGDLKTLEEVSYQKIKYPKESLLITDASSTENEVQEDSIQLGYHDAPVYPISDEIFDLKAVDEQGKDLHIIYEIKSEGFRDFKIGLGKILDFEDKGKIVVSCFEPILFGDFMNDEKDYYEIEIEQPTKQFEFFFELTPEYEFVSFILEYSNEEFPKKKIKSQKIEKNKEGNSTLHFILSEPEVGKRFIIHFSIKKLKDLSYFEPQKDSFRTGIKVYEWLKENYGQEFQVIESEGNLQIKRL